MELQKPEAPKYWTLAEHFVSLIRSGELRPGQQLPSFAQLKSEHGASRPTAERMLTLLEKQNLIDRRSGYGIFVAESVGAPPARHGVIGLYGDGFNRMDSSSYWARLMQGIQNRAGESGSQLMLLQGHVGHGWEKLDGVIMYGRHNFEAIPEQFPIVSLFKAVGDWAGVCVDEVAAIRHLTAYLISIGHRRVAYLHGIVQPTRPERVDGYLSALRAAGIEPADSWMRPLSSKCDYGHEFTDRGFADVSAWLQDESESGWRAQGCTALLCHNDETAIGAMQAFAAAGLSVPGDVSVAGFDGTEIGDCFRPRLTTVEMPLREMGELAVVMLQRQIEADEVSNERQELEVALKIRESTAPPSGNV